MTIKLEFFAPFTLTLVTSWKRSFMRLLTCLLIVRFFVCVCVSKTIHSRNGSKRSKLPGKIRLEQDLYFLYKFSLLTDLHKSQRNYDNHNKAKKEGGERERQQGDCSYVCSYACGKTIHLGSSTASFCPYYTPILPLNPKSLFGLVLEGPHQPK